MMTCLEAEGLLRKRALMNLPPASLSDGAW